MPTKRVERGHLYLDGSTLIAEISDGEQTYETNNEQGHGTDGSIYFSIGNPTTRTTFKTMKPAEGYSVADLEDRVLNQNTDVLIVTTTGNTSQGTEGTFISMKHSWTAKNGMLVGDFEHMGGPLTPL